jgi:hypothetical protein
MGTVSRRCSRRDDLAQRRTPIIFACADEDLNSRVGGVERDKCQNTGGATDEFNRERNLATAGRIEDGINPVWRNRADTFEEAVAVGNGLGANRSQVLEIALARRTNYPCPARDCKLNRERTHATGGGVHEQRLARLNAQLVEHGPRGAARAGTLPATSQPMSAGLVRRLAGSASADSEMAGVSELPITSSPTWNSVTPGPT